MIEHKIVKPINEPRPIANFSPCVSFDSVVDSGIIDVVVVVASFRLSRVARQFSTISEHCWPFSTETVTPTSDHYK